MGKASSNKKVQRAARAAGRPGAKKSYAWPMAITGVVLVGVLLIVFSLSGGDEDEGGIRVGDHWHAAYGIYNCDTYLGPLADARGDEFGIHTHQDYLMHMHPVSSRVTGDGANLGVFINEIGGELSDDSLEVAGMDVENGDECGGDEATLKLVTWDDPSQEQPTVLTEGFEDYAPANSSVWVLAFTSTDGTEVPLPPGAINLADPLAAEEGRQPATATTTLPAEDPTATTVPGEASTTTIPPTDESTTTTTAAP
jgi:hypothetical protein